MTAQTQHFANALPSQFQPILDHAMNRFQLHALSIHGPIHWLKVFRNATTLAGLTANADVVVCQHFALLHDCERRNEGFDPQHGPRAALFAEELFAQGN